VASAPFDQPLGRVGIRLDELRQFVRFLDDLPNHPRAAELARTSRAWAYVSLAAAIEDFVRDFVDEMATYINKARQSHAALKLGVLSLVQAPKFDGVAASRRQDVWDRRAEILKMAESVAVAELLVGLRPLDGRTIRAGHLRTLWTIFELPGDPVPSPVHGLALKDLAAGRNAVAHGSVDPLTFGGQKAYVDVIRRIEQVEDIAVHVAAAGATYVAAGGFLR
jgi:hypothetical protein